MRLLRYLLAETQAGRLTKSAALELLAETRDVAAGRQPPHPLLHTNSSDLSGTRYTTVFSGNEFFFADHVVRNARTLPGVCYLEMAREAALRADGRLGTSVDPEIVVRLRNVVWQAPIAVEGAGITVHIDLVEGDDGVIEFEIHSAGKAAHEAQIHSQGRACIEARPTTRRIDIDELKSVATSVLDVERCYDLYARSGIVYGAAHRGIEHLAVGIEGDRRFVIAKLSLAESVRGTQSDYVLHPAIADSALQASIGLMAHAQIDGRALEPPKPSIPFAVDEVEIVGRCPPSAYAYIRESRGTTEKVRKLDVDICDLDGTVCARLIGFAARVLEDKPPASQVRRKSPAVAVLESTWRAQPVDADGGYADNLGTLAAHTIFLDPALAASVPDMQSEWPDVEIAQLPIAGTVDEQFVVVVERVFAAIKSNLAAKSKGRTVMQVVWRSSPSGDAKCIGALAPLFKTAQLENPKFIGQVIDVGDRDAVAALRENRAAVEGEIRYRGSVREVTSFVEHDRAALNDLAASSSAWRETPWRVDGVYLVTGGAGGLGRIVARAIAVCAPQSTIVLAGRAPATSELQAWLASSDWGRARGEYLTLDVGDRSSVEQCVLEIASKYGRLNGIVHAAGVTHDAFIFNKELADLRRVLTPKVCGLVNLDEATASVRLDFLLAFSSVSGTFGNVGQSDYSCANAFMDRYVEYRAKLCEQGLRHGRTLSIAWPYWEEGGMRLTAAGLANLQQLGLHALSNAAGIAALNRVYASNAVRAVVVAGEDRTLAPLRHPNAQSPSVPNADAAIKAASPALDSASTRERLVNDLREILATLLRVGAEEIEADIDFSEFGFDSIMLTECGNELNKRYALSLAPTIFFEHSSVASLTEHLLSSYGDQLSARFASVAKDLSSPAAGEAIPAEPVVSVRSVVAGARAPRGMRGGAVSVTKATEDETIAIIGVSGRFPAARDIDEFWRNLQSGKDCISEVPLERWDWRAIYGDPKREPNKTRIKWGGFIEGIAEFDPLFFGISPHEALFMDPQQRLLLMYTWKAIEDAGYAPRQLAGSSTGIFVGTAATGYGELLARARLSGDGYGSTGSVPSMGPNRVSYFLDLHGPSEPIETACSSSLVAVHRAVRAMQCGDCEMAIAGGVNLIVTPAGHIGFDLAGMLSPDGRCKTFSAHANGYVRGEGVGMLVLKKLTAAERDGDYIYGVVKGSAENHGGRANSLTAPNPKAQAELIKAACRNARIDPATITYIEAHGTGTELGDPIEINGLKSAFKDLLGAPPRAECGLGSVKSNIGHLELASGVAGIIKVLLQFRYGVLAKTLHADDINPYIELEDSHFYIVREAREWRRLRDERGAEIPRRAGISSFGFGGVNAHVVLEEYLPKARVGASSGKSFVIALSARSAERLRQVAADLLREIEQGRLLDADLPRIAATLQNGREAMEHRLAFLAESLDDFRDGLVAFIENRTHRHTLHHGELKRGKDSSDGDELAQIDRWLADRQLDRLALAWARGAKVDWRKLYGGSPPQRISLPTYPFATDRYWIDVDPALAVSALPMSTHVPFIRRVVSTDVTAFDVDLRAGERYFQDHVLGGQSVLPGAMYLEIAWAAAAELSDAVEHSRPPFKVSDVVWHSPIVCEGSSIEARISLYEGDPGKASFEIETVLGLHCRGVIAPLSIDAPTLDLDAIRRRCSSVEVEGASVYAAFEESGIAYGPAHRGLVGLNTGSDSSGERWVLARLKLPAEAAASISRFGLHPSLLDGALQASIGLTLDTASGKREGAPSLGIPFALRELQVFGALPTECCAVVRARAGDRLQGVDIDVCDLNGAVRARLLGLSTRVRGESRPLRAVVAQSSVQREISSTLLEAAVRFLRETIARTMKLAVEQLDVDQVLEKYGMDSLMALRLIDELQPMLGPLPKTLFFEYGSVRELADYFVADRRERLEERLNERAGFAAVERTSNNPPASTASSGDIRAMAKKNFQGFHVAPSANSAADPIAIVGLAGSYPKAPTLNQFWENLKSGRDCISEIPAERWDLRGFFDPEKGKPGKSYSKWGGFLEGADHFDPLFFSIAPREAQFMDPQERLFLQCVYHAIEDAGHTRASLNRQAGGERRVGVFTGVMYQEYQLHAAQAQAFGIPIVAGGSSSSIANRVAYFCDFTGPSLAVDTMCSSSLTAIHLACQSLRLGECEVAIAGGVNLSPHPNKYLSLSQSHFASSTGRCESFGDGGDGYVPGEGVGVVVLKALAQALRDGDGIYAIIKGSAINHGGKSNGYTAPNPRAQARVIVEALRRANVDPRTISYVEAHGTGTALGDPIEIAGLTKAFKEASHARDSGDDASSLKCAIGSVKSNIGHLESAAGIAGLTKILLQLRHATLVPSIHSSTLNSNIDFSATPFVVQRTLAPWQASSAQSPTPRRASLSAFGAGGSNAHLVIEEFRAAALPRREPGVRLFVLSARTLDRLRAVSKRLLEYLEADTGDIELADVAYTLQVGREPMDHRLGFVARTCAEAAEVLRDFLDNEASVARFQYSECRRGSGALGRFGEDEDFQKTLTAWLEKGKFDSVLAAWTGGTTIDWARMYGTDGLPRRVSLPTYPFETESYWIRQPADLQIGSTAKAAAELHPLLQRNTSTLAEQRYSTRLNGTEFFLRDHRVNGTMMVPGVAYLEMARAAIADCVGGAEASSGIVLEDVVWLRPLAVLEPRDVHVTVHRAAGEAIEFEVYSSASGGTETADAIVHARGRVGLKTSAAGEQFLDLQRLQADGKGTVTAEECYGRYGQMGIEYGPAHRSVERLEWSIDERGYRCVLASVALPDCVRSTADEYVLHPSLLDGALQAAIGLTWNEAETMRAEGTWLPYAIERLEIVAPTPREGWVRVAASTPGSSLRKLDIDVCDRRGRICVRIAGFASRAAQDRLPATTSAPTSNTLTPAATANAEAAPMTTLFLAPRWEPEQPAEHLPWPALESAVLIVGGTDAQKSSWHSRYPRSRLLTFAAEATSADMSARLSEQGQLEQVVWLAPSAPSDDLCNDALIHGQTSGVIALFRLVKSMLSLGYGARSLGLTVITTAAQAVHRTERLDPTHASVHGLIGSLAKEIPNWAIRLVDLPLDTDSAECAPAPEDIARIPADPQGNAWAFRNSEWYRQQLLPCEFQQTVAPKYRMGGVYVIVGGAGGLGEVFSEYLLKCSQAQLVWLGRRALDENIRASIERLSAYGPAPVYLQVDATDRSALARAHETIHAGYGTINGVVHAAIALLDKSVTHMDEARFRAGLASKVDVSVRLAQVFAHDSLDWVLFFSSLQSFFKSPGQSNYAAGCTFKDAYAHALSTRWKCPVKVMNWGYWGSVGVVASEAYRQRMARQGVGSIESVEGMPALDALLSAPLHQLAFLKTAQTSWQRPGSALAERITVLAQELPSKFDRLSQRTARNLEFPHVDTLEANAAAELQRWMGRMLVAQLGSIGVFASGGSSVADRAQLKLPPMYRQWTEASVRMLADTALLRAEGDRVVPSDPNDLDSAKLLSEWNAFCARWTENPRLGAQIKLLDASLRALPSILTGRRPATDVLFPNSSMELLEGIYKSNPVADFYNRVLADALVEFVSAQDEEGRLLRILEIGAGTGGTSDGVFRELRPFAHRIAEYCYTDVSQAFLLHGKRVYGDTAPWLTCRLFNVEQSPVEQGMEIGAYDVVIASNVLHATRQMHQTLRNAKSLLKRHGLLLINEISTSSLFAHLTFGLLPGWWRYDDGALRIAGTPALAAESWRHVLEAEGFQAVSFPAEAAHLYGQQVILAESDGAIRQSRTLAVQSELAQRSIHFERSSVATRERDASSMVGPSAVTIDEVRAALRRAIGLALDMEVKRIENDREFSEYGVDSILAVNLIKTVNEQFDLTLPTTTLFDYPTVERLSVHIAGELKSKPLPAPNRIIGVNESDMTASRVGESDRPEGRSIRERIPAQSSHLAGTSAAQSGTYRRVVIRGPGGIEDLAVETVPIPVVNEREVQVAVHAFSLNFGDLLCVRGLYPTMPPYPFTPGFEISGTVVAVGARVTAIKPGDRVVAAMGQQLGGHATLVTCHESQVSSMPARLSFEQACALPAVAITMIDAFDKAQLQPSERILIQTAAGGTGLIAVQLAKHFGAEIFATAGSQQKLDYLKSLGVAHTINYLQTDFETEIERLTEGRGVDVVINTLGGEAIQKGLNCLAPGGRYIEIAMTALKSARNMDLSVLNNNQTFYSIDLRKLGMMQPNRLAKYSLQLAELVEQGVISPTLSAVLPFDRVKDAYRQLDDRQNIGKVVVSVDQPESIGAAASVPAIRSTSTEREPIAIIGMSGRFAKANNVTELWQSLAGGLELTEEVARWPLGEEMRTAAAKNDGLCHRGGFLTDIGNFDPLFFNISGAEATYMDPQQRLFLEESWKALEDAGHAGESIEGRRCGVYVGCGGGDYVQLFGGQAPAQAFWGNAASVIPGRISYCLNLQGPAIAVDTACSSSLVALHLACQGLWNRDADLALAGGVHVQCTPSFYLMASRAGMLSRTGRCYAFDERADGFVPGEGVGAIVLKRLSDAVRDGDHIYGVIRGTGTNQDGATNGITAPSALSQTRLEREVYDAFRIHPEEIQMLEAHGTGTVLGDPIEWRALTKAFGADTSRRQYCAIGSIKTNIGHTATAAGVAGVIKILLALQHARIPPSLNFERGNAHIDMENSPFFVNTTLREWSRVEGRKRCAAVSSFGFSGTNAHVVIEEPPERERSHHVRPAYLIVLSARTSEQLQEQAANLASYCESRPDTDCGNASFTLLTGRKHFDHRLACVAGNAVELAVLLRKWLGNGDTPGVFVGEVAPGEARRHASLQRYGEQCIDALRRDLSGSEYMETVSTVADLFVQGYRLGFPRLFADGGYARIPLPTYPFARERYWVEHAAQRLGSSIATTAALHPLLQRNTSTLQTQRFSSVLNGEESFLRDHRVAGNKVLPAVAYLEMIRAAMEHSASMDGRMHAHRIALRHVAWRQPLVVDAPREVHVSLQVNERDEVEFRVYTLSETGSGAPANAHGEIVHAQGRATLASAHSEREPRSVDVATLEGSCDAQTDVAECYGAFDAAGIEFGPAHRGLQSVRHGLDHSGSRYVLARVSLPTQAAENADRYVLHPSVMDSALQASLGLLSSSENPGGGDAAHQMWLPFALEELKVFERTPANAWVVVRPVAHSPASIDGIRKQDIEIYDEFGSLCVSLGGLTFRASVASLDGPRADRSSPIPSVAFQESESNDASRGDAPGAGPAERSPIERSSRTSLREWVVDFLKRELGFELKVAPDRIETDTGLERYGIDSVLALQITGRLETTFGPLAKTLLFEYQNVGTLSDYFLEQHHERLVERFEAHRSVGAEASDVQAASLGETSDLKRRRTMPASAVANARLADEGGIAIIGLSGRYPGAKSLADHWDNLRSGRDSITELPKNRWDAAGEHGGVFGGFMDGVDEFDPRFFGISPREAEVMDPQERLFLQCAYATLEDAGYTRDALSRCRAGDLGGNVGVFVGVMYEEYQLYGAQAQALGHRFALSGNPSSIANRVSYFCNFHGPSLAIDTMCSSSLTAIHIACRSLRSGECALALAGGVNVSIHPNKYLLLKQGRFLSSNGRCASFGASGDGYVPGEGVGAVLLKPLSRAVADGDRIYGVIRGSAINHGGKTNGYTVPNPQAQAHVIARAIEEAAVEPRAISYIEAHGTGTSLGDPIEIAGLSKAFGTDAKQFCAIGSTKSNIGHLESAAGIAGLTKVLLQMQHGKLAPSLHSDVLNPYIDFTNSPFTVQRSLKEWQRPVLIEDGHPREYGRIAGVSAFGAGGSNAHLIVEEYRTVTGEPRPRPQASSPVAIVLSARNQLQLQRRIEQLRDHLSTHDEIDLFDLAYTLQVGREAMEHRFATRVTSLDELRSRLALVLSEATLVPGADLYFGKVDREDATSRAAVYLDTRETTALQAWVRGVSLDWEATYEGQTPDGIRPRRIALPTYPFSAEKYWLAAPDNSVPRAESGLPRPGVFDRMAEENRALSGAASVALLEQTWLPLYSADAMPEIGAANRLEDADRWVLFDPALHHQAASFADSHPNVRVVALPESVSDLAADFNVKSLALFATVQDIVKSKLARTAVVQVVLATHDRESSAAVAQALLAFLRSVYQEQPKCLGEVLLCDSLLANASFVAQVSKVMPLKLRHVDVDEEVRVLGLCSASSSDAVKPWRRNGVYLISGGFGGLGRKFALEILSSTEGTKVVLTGRSPDDEPRRRQVVEAFGKYAERVEYRQVNVADGAAVTRAVRDIVAIHGALSGVLHCAGLTHDKLLTGKTSQEFAAVLEPKVDGTVNLDLATRTIELDFFVLFSSLAGVTGNLGQSDYALANAFQDAYAVYRNSLAVQGRCYGHTLAIAWPLWETGGMQLPASMRDALLKRAGIVPLPSDEGIKAFYAGLEARLERIVVLFGDVARIVAGLSQSVIVDSLSMAATYRESNLARDVSHTQSIEAAPVTESTPASVVDLLRKRLSELLKWPLDDIDNDAEWGEFGLDSVGLVTLANTVGAELMIEINAAAFLEHTSIRRLADHIVAEEPDAVAALETHLDKGGTSTVASAEAWQGDLRQAPTYESTPREDVSSHATASSYPSAQEPIAIIGVGANLPYVGDDWETVWDRLVTGEHTALESGEERWGTIGAAIGEAGALPQWLHPLQGFADFDHEFFGMSAADAAVIDPQERLFLASCWHAMEDAGYTPANLLPPDRRNGAVFVGVTKMGHQLVARELQSQGQPVPATAPIASIANRVSHWLDLAGPSLPVDTMCSASLTAIHLACESLRRGECEIAFAGGVNLYLHPTQLVEARHAKLLSDDAATRSFGKGGSGFVPGEAAAAILLKPLSLALVHGDPIRGIIRGSAINHSGRTLAYFTPNPKMQAAAITAALRSGGLSGNDIGYVEAQGVGSELNDTVEIDALRLAYLGEAGRRSPLRIGAVKPNLGHAEAASTMVQLIKVLLQFKHRQFAPTVRFDPIISRLEKSAELVGQFEHEDWKTSPSGARRAGISSFGAGGAGGHIIIEEPPPESVSTEQRGPSLFVFSARTSHSLQRNIRRFIGYLDRLPPTPATESSAARIAYTLQVGRESMRCRVAAVASGIAQLRTALNQYLANGTADGLYVNDLGEGKAARIEPDAIAELFANRHFRALAALWVGGAAIDWDALNVTRRQRVALPGYAFAERHCWIRTLQTASSKDPRHDAAALASDDSNSDSGDFLVADINVPKFVVDARTEEQWVRYCAYAILQRLIELDVVELTRGTSEAEILSRVPADEHRHRFIRAVLGFLVTARMLTFDGGLYRTDPTIAADIEEKIGRFTRQFELHARALPEITSWVNLLKCALERYRDLLQPNADSEALLLANADAVEVLNDLLAGNRRATSNTSWLLEKFLTVHAESARDRPLRMLEIGAGSFDLLRGAARFGERSGCLVEYTFVSDTKGLAGFRRTLGERLCDCAQVGSCGFADLPRLVEHTAFDVIVLRAGSHLPMSVDALIETAVKGMAEDGSILIGEPMEAGVFLLALGAIGPEWLFDRGSESSAVALGARLKQLGFLSEEHFAPWFGVYSRRSRALTAVELDAGPGVPSSHEEVRDRVRDIYVRALGVPPEELDARTDLRKFSIPSLAQAKVFVDLRRIFGGRVEAVDVQTAHDITMLTDAILSARSVAEQALPVGERSRFMEAVKPRMLVRRSQLKAEELQRAVMMTSRGQRIEYFSCGQGEPIVVMTALAFTKTVWEHQIRNLSQDYRLIFPHLPGHAGSTFNGRGLTFDQCADDVVELMDHLAIDDFHLAAWCMAGNIAQLLALKYPTRLRSLFLICTTPTDAAERGLSDVDLQSYVLDPMQTYELELESAYADNYLNNVEVAEHLQLLRLSAVSVERSALMHYLLALFEFSTLDRLHELKMPVSIVGGRYDVAFPADQVALLGQRIPHSQFTCFESSGHVPFVSEHAKFNALYRTFLRGSAGASAVEWRAAARETST